MNVEELETKIVDVIKSMPEREMLKKAEEAMMNDKATLEKIAIFQQAMEEYNFVLKSLPNEKELIKKRQTELYLAKKDLDESDLVKEYNRLFQICNEPLWYIEQRLINLFQRKGHHQCLE